MTEGDHPRGRGVRILEGRAEGAGAVSEADGISECTPPLPDRLSRKPGAFASSPGAIGFPSDLEGVLEWARRAAEDRSEVPALLDELDPTELRRLAARLTQLVGLLELCPADVEPLYFIARIEGLSGDFAQDPWTSSEAD